ncbi:MAG TPA: serine/threonine-protein kinase [Polyangiaceae bacterium]
MEPSLDPIAPGVVLDGRYRIERTLGSGSMGVVVLARHLELARTVAIKVLRPELAGYAGVATRFRDEARATASIRSEHAVRVYDVSPVTVHPPFIVMERLRGADLEALLQQAPFSAGDAVDYLLQACAGVAAAHALGIIHRDLKPANLFLAEDGSGAHVVKVLDFGIAKSIHDESRLQRMTISGETKGTPAYMSPEQLETPGDLDVTTDVWALGVILFELLTGELPFQAANIARLGAAILNDSPRKPSALREGLAPELDAIALRCLEKKRSDRYPGVVELAEALALLAAKNGPERLARVRAAASPTTPLTEPPADDPPPSREEPPQSGAVVFGHRSRQELPTEVLPRRRPVAWIAAVAGTLVATVVGVIALIGLSGWAAPAIETSRPAAAPVPPAVTAAAEPVVTLATATVDTPAAPLTAAPSATPSAATGPSARGARGTPSRPVRGAGQPASDEDREFGGRK